MSYVLRRVEIKTDKGLYWGGNRTVRRLEDAEVFPTKDGPALVLEVLRTFSVLNAWWHAGQIVTVEEAQAMDIASLL